MLDEYCWMLIFPINKKKLFLLVKSEYFFLGLILKFEKKLGRKFFAKQNFKNLLKKKCFSRQLNNNFPELFQIPIFPEIEKKNFNISLKYFLSSLNKLKR